MKVCIFSDVHGNDTALEAMLSAEEERCDAFIFAGDIFGYFYGQEAIIDRMMEIKNLTAVRGNHEQYYLSRADKDALTDRYGSSYAMEVDENRQRFLENLPVCADVMMDGRRFQVFHGSPLHPTEGRIYPDTPDAEIGDVPYDCLVLGHTHYRMARTVGNCLVINPGSLGQPRDGAECSYCVFDTADNRYEFRTVAVDFERLLREARQRDKMHSVYNYLMRKYGEEA